jgi:hypothetical protein
MRPRRSSSRANAAIGSSDGPIVPRNCEVHAKVGARTEPHTGHLGAASTIGIFLAIRLYRREADRLGRQRQAVAAPAPAVYAVARHCDVELLVEQLV